VVTIILGILFIAVALYTILPISWGLGWMAEFMATLKGFVPLFLLFMGVLFLLVGVLMIKDKIEARKEEKKIQQQTEQENKESDGNK